MAMPNDSGLAGKRCLPCQAGGTPLDGSEAGPYLRQLSGWQLVGVPLRVQRTLDFRNFASAQRFALEVGNLAEEEGHHPEITYGWGYCTVSFWTHKIDGLHENDFIMAAKVDGLAASAEGLI